MLIIGCDFHPGFQQLAIFDNQTGEIRYRRLRHVEEAQEFYASLSEAALVGMEACGHTQWFEQMLAELGHELWPTKRFANAKRVSSYVGLIPREHSSGGKQRLGHISKQGNPLLRFLLVEAAQSAIKGDAEFQRAYVRLALRRSRGQAKVAIARRLATRLYWMLRTGKDYAQLKASGAGKPESFRGAA